MFLYGIIAVIIGYLLGSIPTAYIVARLATGKDIRQMGGGNVGGLNTFREVGRWAIVPVAIIDVGKGAAAVAIAYWLLDLSPTFVILAGLASVVGHNWMVWLKFSGGKGMGATYGSLFVLFPLYGYWQGILISLGLFIIMVLITRNVALGSTTSLVAIPFITWLGMDSGIGTIMAVILGLAIALKFYPTAREAMTKSKSTEEFVFDRWQRDKKEGD